MVRSTSTRSPRSQVCPRSVRDCATCTVRSMVWAMSNSSWTPTRSAAGYMYSGYRYGYVYNDNKLIRAFGPNFCNPFEGEFW